jgi:hypothetical protein
VAPVGLTPPPLYRELENLPTGEQLGRELIGGATVGNGPAGDTLTPDPQQLPIQSSEDVRFGRWRRGVRCIPIASELFSRGRRTVASCHCGNPFLVDTL